MLVLNSTVASGFVQSYPSVFTKAAFPCGGWLIQYPALWMFYCRRRSLRCRLCASYIRPTVFPVRAHARSQTLPVKSFKLNIAKKEVEFFETSFKPYGLSCMSNPAFLNNVIDFGKFGKDKINEETIEFLVPYLEIEGFNPQVRACLATAFQLFHVCYGLRFRTATISVSYPYRYPWPKPPLPPFTFSQEVKANPLSAAMKSR